MSKKNNETAAAIQPNPARQLYDESKTKVADESDNLETIREILFGEQTREAEKRRHDTHRTLQSNIADLQKESKQQFEFLSKEINKLYNLVNNESEARVNQSNELINSLQQSVLKVSENSEIENSKLHKKLLDESNRLETESTKKYEEISEKLEQVSLELKSDKTDKGDLAQLLQGMANQLLDKNK